MAARPVQISLDERLLERVDADPETRARGRSAFVRSAIAQYLAAKERRQIDAWIVAAYRGKADELAGEVADLMDVRASTSS
jgi:metal-responsive CopG/Arc/MetJ family transcriptional regulator